jgi:PHS family inorganic phosphate transporter-like MFS transporter
MDYDHLIQQRITDSIQYDIFVIGLVTTMLGVVYFGGTIPANSDTAIKVATSVS